MKYLIIGAGPAGLTLGCALIEKGIKDFLIIEKEDTAGGLCRSEMVGGSPFDTGGGHFLDVRRPAVNKFLFKYMPEEEWSRFERDSRIDLYGQIIGSPIEANIWMLDIDSQVDYLKTIAQAGCVSGEPVPERFTDWIYWKLGRRIADDYMIPYNRKMFGADLDILGTYWLEKLPDVSFEDTLRSCLEHRAYAKQPGHASFYYPKKAGYGELWQRMADSLGERLITGVCARELDAKKKTVNNEFSADAIINTAPWTSFKEIRGVDEETIKNIGGLKYTSVVTEYNEENLDTKAQWIYYPDPEISYHRILVRKNFLSGSVGYWTETNLQRFSDGGKPYFVNEYAYPLNTIGKNEKMEKVLKEMEKHSIIGLGRWGEWQHYNSDLVAERAMALAERLS